MNQILSKSLSDATKSHSATLVYLIEIKANDPIYLHTGVGTIEYNSKQWHGIGQIGDVGSVSQKSSIGTNPITFSLNALDDEALILAFKEGLVLKDARVYMAALDKDHSTVNAAKIVYTGFISDVGISYGSSNSISIEISNKIEKWSDGLPHTYSEQTHRLKFPNDRFFRYQSATANMTIRWGDTKSKQRDRY